MWDALLQRPGAFAMYLEPWHFDIFDFLELKKNTGKEEQRARDLFYALWIPDLFMKRVEENEVGGQFSELTFIRPFMVLMEWCCKSSIMPIDPKDVLSLLHRLFATSNSYAMKNIKQRIYARQTIY